MSDSQDQLLKQDQAMWESFSPRVKNMFNATFPFPTLSPNSYNLIFNERGGVAFTKFLASHGLEIVDNAVTADRQTMINFIYDLCSAEHHGDMLRLIELALDRMGVRDESFDQSFEDQDARLKNIRSVLQKQFGATG